MNDTVIPTCPFCAFKIIEGEQMKCNRFPPQVAIFPAPHPMTHEVQLQIMSSFPPVNEAMVCGEFTDAEDTAPLIHA